MVGSPVLRLESVGVRYAPPPAPSALVGIDWVVEAGERWAVIGPNGCGKTTLVQLVTGWLHPSSGELEVLGARLGHGVDWRVHRQRIGVVSAGFAKQIRPTLPALDVVMTAKYAALEPWWHEYTDTDRARATALLASAGFEYLVDRPFGICSEGERQQIQLARILMGDPQLVVLDEPAAGLDLGARERLIARLSALAAEPASPPLVLVTHHVEEIPPSFTHALLLARGGIVAQGPIAHTLTSELVSKAFEIDVRIDRGDGRFSARALP